MGLIVPKPARCRGGRCVDGGVDGRVDDNVLLHGPSGTGKSLVARAIAKEAGVNLIMVGGPELFSKWLGESEEAVRHVFKLARELAPCVVFFDQLDAVAPVRGRSAGTWTTERVLHQLIAQWRSAQTA